MKNTDPILPGRHFALTPPLRRTALALLIASCFGAAYANPSLPQVVSGQAAFNQQGNVFSITNTPNTIINWQSFSIHAGEITRFIQENSNSAVLNRITGQDPSKILGTLESNGKVFLINPNGIVFGQGARVDVQGLVASSLGISNEDFLAGKRQFTAGTVAGAVSNAGAIQAAKGGQVLLIAPNVENTGIITAPNGDVILAAGRSVQLADPGNPDLRVLVAAPADQALNLGSIIAHGGTIGMAGALVSQRGMLNANSAVVGENGKIVLKASGQSVLSAGSVTTATGAGKGGEVQVLGDQVGLFGDATVDASGKQGGGTVLLGGDYQGKNSAVQNARQVVVGKDASIVADAIEQGNGGKVIVWGDESTRMHGSISARGGVAGGNGGFVETSGHYLAIDGARVDTRARTAQGKTGDWLLDPYNIDVVAGNGGSLNSVDEFGDLPVTGTTTIGADQISNASSNVVLQAQNDININAAIAITQGNVGFKAQAGNSINVNNAISTNGGALILSANDNGGSTAQGSSAVLNLNAAIASQGGNVSLTGADIIFGAAGSVNLGAGNATLHANKFDGKINLNGSGGQIIGTGAAGQTVALQADNMNLQGGVALGGAAGGGAVSLSVESAGRQINLGSKAAGKLSLSGADLSAVSAGTLTIGNAGMTGAIGVDQAVTVASGATGPGTLVLQTTGGIAIANALSVAGNLSVNAGGAVSAAGAVTVGGTFTLGSGTWSQNAASLPAFSASNFVIGSGPNTSFLRTTGGTGSSGNPYLISDIYGLQGIAGLNLGNSYRLVNNIDASGTANWNGTSGFVPIAGGSGRYSGTFDGGGFAISNLKIDGGAGATWPTGLFGTLHGGILRNLSLNGGSVAGAANVGALVGNVMGGSTIDNVSSSAAVSGQSNVGGLVGTNAGTITRAGSSGSVTGVNVSGAGAIGGLVGQNTSEGRISTTYATGTVTGAREMVGGLIGNNLGVLAQSYATGNVSGGRSIGGLVGSNGGGIDDSYATGAVSGAANADPGLAKENIGGLIGESTGRVSHVFSSGQVNGTAYANVGAVAGRVANGSPFGYSFFNYETSGVQTDAGGSSGLSTAQMMQGGSFNSFDFSSVWRIYDGYTTPMLKAFLKPLTVTVSGNTTSKVYDGQLASFDGVLAYQGLLDGDTAANGALAYQSARNVGTYGLTGLWSTKYDITVGGTTSLSITPRVLTVSVGGSKVYDGQLGFDQANFGLGNVVAGDNVGVSGSAVFLDKNAGTGKAVHVSGLSLEDNALGNYSLAATTLDGTADIVARTLNVSFTGINKIYDGNISAGVNISDDRVAGDALTVAGNASFTDKNAGSNKTVNVNGVGVTGADAGNYVLSSHSGNTTADIAARTLNVSFTGINKIYDGNTSAGVTINDDRVAGDALTVAGNASFADKNAGSNKTVNVNGVGVTGTDAGNYVLSSHSGSTTADIAARTLNLSFIGINKTYDGNTSTGVNISDDRVAGDALTVAGNASFADKNAGTGKTVNVNGVGVTGADAGNYVLSSHSGSTTADIAARTLNLSFIGINKIYDGNTSAGVNISDDRVAGDALTVAGNASFVDKNAGSNKTVNVNGVVVTGADAGNYVLNSHSGSTTADIAARTLNVSFTGINKTYDGNTSTGVTINDDRVAGDALTVAGNASFADKNAGSNKTVNVNGVGVTGADAGNYVLSSHSGSTTADIAARTLNLSFGGINKTYDGNTSAGVTVKDDRVAGDALSVAGNASFADKNAGSNKTVNVNGVGVTGADAGNYVLSSHSGSTTADIATRALNVSATGVNKIYDGGTAASVVLGDDRVTGDVLGLAANASFADKNVGAGKAVTLNGVALSGQDAGNYFLVLPTGWLASITPAALNLTNLIAGNKVYDGTTNATVSAGVSGLLGQDAVSLVGGSGSFADKNAGADKLVTASGFRLTGADAGNYVLNSTGATTHATISQKLLSTWIGSGNGLWSDAANWDGGVVPEGANVLAVDFSHSSGIVTYNAAAGNTSLKTLNLSSGLLLTGGSLSLGENAQDRSVFGGSAGLEVTGGNLLLNGSLSADRYAQSGGLLSGNGNLAIGNSFSQTAGAINLGGQLAINQANGDLRFASLAASDVRLTALNGAIGQTGAIVAASLNTQSSNGTVLDNAGNQVASFTASNSGNGGIVLNNTSVPGSLALGDLSSGGGNIAIDNSGGIVAGNISTTGGNVTLTAHSPITVNGGLKGNDITLTADADIALVDGASLAAAGNVSLNAGRDLSFSGAATVATGGNFVASAGGNVRFADTASFTVPAAASMTVQAKTGSITGTSGVRINRQRSDVSLLAPGGTVSMADAIFLPATVPPVIPPSVNTAINDALNVIKQGDRANTPLLPTVTSTTVTDKKKDDGKEVATSDQSTGNKFNDGTKKMYCN